MTDPEKPSLPTTRETPAAHAGERTAMDQRLLEILVCPITRGSLIYDRETQELISKSARYAYPVRDGIPILIIDEARRIED